jgi:hypothetical protein
VTLTSNDDNGINEPEAKDGDTTDGPGQGELAQAVNFLWWADDGDNVLEDGETVLPGGPLGALAVGESASVALADSATNIWTGTGGPAPGNQTLHVGKAWCFGAIAPAPLSQDGSDTARNPSMDNDNNGTPGQPQDGGITCDGASLNNITQTDSLTADVSFSATQSRNNPGFLCAPPPPPPTLLACTDPAVQRWADNVTLFAQGRTKAGNLIDANRSDPSKALGAAQSSGTPYDTTAVGNFVSLGFGVGTTSPRSITLSFNDNIVADGPGADMRLYEVTNGSTQSPYPDEKVMVEVSQNGSTWQTASSSAARDADIDLAGTGLPWIKYVRITDINNPADFSDSVADGYDLDAVSALNCALPLTQ